MSARELAAKVQPGSAVRWDRIERAGFDGHPAVLAALDGKNGVERRQTARWKFGLAIPFFIGAAYFFIAPIAGFAVLASGRFQEYRTPSESVIPLSGFFFGCAAVYLLGWLIAWFVTGRRHTGIGLTYSLMTTVLGVIAAFALASAGQRESVDGWQVWVAVVWAAVGLAVVFAGLQFLSRVRSRPADSGGGDELPPNMVAQLHTRRAAVAQLSEADRLAIKRDLDDAVLDLERRGLIGAEVSERARTTDLGGLALRMR